MDGKAAMGRSVLKWELIGIAVISVLGSVLHFAFALSGNSPAVGVFAAVNESVFEHLKLTYWPTVVYAAFTYGFLRKSTSNFIIAKTAGIYVMPLAIIMLFYSYKGVTGIESLAADIVIFVVAIALGQLTSYRILKASQLPPSLKWVALAFLVALGVIYGVFTFYTPHIPLFMESTSGTYGIPR